MIMALSVNGNAAAAASALLQRGGISGALCRRWPSRHVDIRAPSAAPWGGRGTHRVEWAAILGALVLLIVVDIGLAVLPKLDLNFGHIDKATGH